MNERDFAYLGTFLLGAVLGLALFAKLLQWLLERHRKVTLVVITGLLLGALRALWPWQPWADPGDRSILAPTTDVPVTRTLMAAGFAFVVGILLVERFARSRGGQQRPRATRRFPPAPVPLPQRRSARCPSGTSARRS